MANKYTKENVRLVFDYPFNNSNDLKDMCAVGFCLRKEKMVQKQYIQEVKERSVLIREYAPWSYDLRLLNILTNLQGMTLGNDLF